MALKGSFEGASGKRWDAGLEGRGGSFDVILLLLAVCGRGSLLPFSFLQINP